MDELDLTGRWILRQETATLSRVAVVGRVRTVTRSWVLYDLTHQGERLFGSGRLLDIQVAQGASPVTIRFPEAFRQAMPPSRLDATLRREAQRLRLIQPRAWTVLGARLTDPIREPLPLEASDPRVWDQDGDGHPGVTIEIEGMVRGRVYVAQRSWSELDGERSGPDRFTGRVRFGEEQVILGASSRFLKKAPKNTPDPTNSRFVLLRVADDATDREALAALERGAG